ncbi:hypothetical protein KKF84_10740, partial [Myxococcota bacterium]|nr:hypothetical protein [Myxococcota bacterium]
MGQTCIGLGYYGGILRCNECQLDLTECIGYGTCGDGVVQPGNESCDGPDVIGTTCTSLGYEGGAIGCRSDCRFDITGCIGGELCGNGVIDTPEVCDGEDLGDMQCTDVGEYLGGTLSCGSDCRLVTADCYDEVICGDGLVQGDEQCDGGNLANQTCATLGYDGGSLMCHTDCTFNTVQCTGEVVCGDGEAQLLEQCDTFDYKGKTCVSLGFVGGELDCTDGCLLDTSACEEVTPDCDDQCVQPGYLVITEVMSFPETSYYNGVYLELKNVSPYNIDLRNLEIRLVDTDLSTQSWTIAGTAPVTVPAGGLFLIGRSSSASENGGLMVDLAISGISMDDVPGRTLGIHKAGGVAVDTVPFINSAMEPHVATSLQLDRDHLTSSANDNASNWCLSTGLYNPWDRGTPREPNASCARESNCADSVDNDGNGYTDCDDISCAFADGCRDGASPAMGDLIITEIMMNGEGYYNANQWFELFNTTAGPVAVQGLTVCSSDEDRTCVWLDFGGRASLPADGYLLAAPSGADVGGVVPDVLYGPTVNLGAPSGDLRVLRRVDGQQEALIDAVSYDSNWPQIGDGVSVQFSSSVLQTASENDISGNWCPGTTTYDASGTLLGTPGEENLGCTLAEICDNGIDDDFNGLVDCADVACDGLQGPGGVMCESAETTCNDGFDNDGNGIFDCQEAACQGSTGPSGEECEPSGEVSCSDGYDNDGDGAVDMDDSDCNMGAGVAFYIYFSEYLEGNSWDKALEVFIHDATELIDMSRCQIQVYSNGASTPTNSLILNPVQLDAGQTFVICHSSISDNSRCDQLIGSGVMTFNGDDALVLRCDGQVRDSIGKVGQQMIWTGGGLSTQNMVLRRKQNMFLG